MNISNASLPYPVLGNGDDYVDSAPEAWLKIDKLSNDKTHKIVYSISFDSQNKELIRLVETEEAALVIELDCPATFQREARIYKGSEASEWLKAGGAEIVLNIDKRNYAGSMSIIAYITALQSFKLKNTGRFHPDYGDSEFPIQPGDVLAVFPGAEKIDLSIDWEHMYKNTGAAVKIVEDDSRDAIVHTVLTSDYIEIHLPSTLHKEFKQTYEQHSLTGPCILMTFAPTAIMKALTMLKEHPGIKSKWADAIRNRIASEPEFKEFCPSGGDWDTETIPEWDDKIDVIVSLLFKDAQEKMLQSYKEIVKLDNNN